MSDPTPSDPAPIPSSTGWKGGRPEKLARKGPYPVVDGTLDRALALVEYLRVHCPWDRKQTALSLIPYLLEESYETVEAIRSGDGDALRDELGDLLLNLAFQVVVGEEEGRFSREEVVAGLEEKMVRRHPHVFGAEEGPGGPESWEEVKARERGGRDKGVLGDLPPGLDPLLLAQRIQARAARVGFDWEAAEGALAKVREEVEEVASALESGSREEVDGELGDLLFSVVNLVRLAGLHAVPTLNRANRKFRRRFEALEARLREDGETLPGPSLEELDRLWEEVKAEEVSTPPPDPPRSGGDRRGS